MITEEERELIDLIDRKELVELTQKLIQIPSVPDEEAGTNEHEVAVFITNWIRENLGVQPIVEEVTPGRENVIATIDFEEGRGIGENLPTTGKTLMLEGHMDVVSAGDFTKWKHGPFSGVIEDGKIYGRGSCDMKAGLAVNLITAKALVEAALSPDAKFRGNLRGKLRGKLRLGFVCDEEGMMIGIKDFIRKGYADDVDACLVPEPEENQLCLTMKGAIRAIVRVTGKMAHGAMPLTGINPNTRMARIILAFEEYEQEEIKRCGKDEYVGYPSITFTVVQAPPKGTTAQLNVMPGEAEGYVDIRTTPCQNHDEIRKHLKEILDNLASKDKDFKAEIEFIEDRPVVTMTKDEPIAVLAADAYRDITGKEPIYNGVPGATDGTFLRAWKGIPSLVNGPGPRHIPHQYDEYVEIDELYEAAKIYLLTEYRYLAT